MLIKEKGSTGWHFAGSNMKVHFLLGRLSDYGTILTKCNQHVNGISVKRVSPKIYSKLVCKTCRRLVK